MQNQNEVGPVAPNPEYIDYGFGFVTAAPKKARRLAGTLPLAGMLGLVNELAGILKRHVN